MSGAQSPDYSSKTEGFTQPSRLAGFTLIELMVSLTIFSILMVVSIGTLLTLIDVNAKAQALASSATNLSFALDSITREIRTGHYYYCTEFDPDTDGDQLPNDATMPGDCTSNAHANFIAFVRDRDDYKVGYRRIVVEEDGISRGVIQQKIQDSDGVDVADWEALTSSDVSIDVFHIIVTDSETYDESSDVDQPVVTLFIKGHVNNGLEEETDFSIQTNITQRRLDQI